MNEHTCSQCGATLRRPSASRIDEVPGNEHVKRALEVALVGNLSIGIIAHAGNFDYALALASAAAGQGCTAVAVQPCPCGNFGDPTRACLCTAEMIAAYQTTTSAYRNALACDVVLIAPTIPAHKALETRRWREADEIIFDRARAARDRLGSVGDELDETGAGVMRAALRSGYIAPPRQGIVMATARAVAALAGETSIRPAHVAEALQYQPSAPYRV